MNAPYEADAQMAFMVKEGLADFAISEDSDLIAYGCRKTLFKIDQEGSGQLFDFDEFQKVTNYKERGFSPQL